MIPSQARQRITPAAFRYALKVHLKLSLPGSATFSTHKCDGCSMVMHTLDLYWLSLCPFSRVEITRRQTAIFRAIHIGLRGAGFCNDVLGFESEGPGTLVDVATTCPTAPSSSAGTQLRRGNPVQMKSSLKNRKYFTAVRAQLVAASFQAHFIPLAWWTFGFTRTTSASWLGCTPKNIRWLFEPIWLCFRHRLSAGCQRHTRGFYCIGGRDQPGAEYSRTCAW